MHTMKHSAYINLFGNQHAELNPPGENVLTRNFNTTLHLLKYISEIIGV